jgi:RNA polymerase sigma-70 factor (ECF subfamily)
MKLDDDEEVKLKKMYCAIYLLNDVDKALIMMYLDDMIILKFLNFRITEINARVKMNRARNKLKQLIKNK